MLLGDLASSMSSHSDLNSSDMDAAAPGTPPPSHQDTNCNESADMMERTRTSWRYLEGGGLRPSGAEQEERRPEELAVAGGEETEGMKREREREREAVGEAAVDGGR